MGTILLKPRMMGVMEHNGLGVGMMLVYLC